MTYSTAFYPSRGQSVASSFLPPVLIVEDDPGVGEFLRDFLLDEGYQPILCYGVRQAIHAVSSNPTLQVALVDVHLTSMTGFDLLEHLSDQGHSLEAVMMTGRSQCDPELWRQVTQVGAHDLLQKPLDHSRLLAALSRAARAARLQAQVNAAPQGGGLAPATQAPKPVQTTPSLVVASSTQTTVAPMAPLGISVVENELLNRLIACARLRDDGMGAHCWRVGQYVRILAEEIGMDSQTVTIMEHAAMLHDLGKIGVPDRLAYKPSPLAPDEIAIMRGHAAIGHGLLAGATHPVLKVAAEIALAHHERFDGSGYPLGLSGDEIPLSARMTAICDVYDAVRMVRPYKAGMDHQGAVRVLTQGDNRTTPQHFDPTLLSLFVRHADRFDRIFCQEPPLL